MKGLSGALVLGVLLAVSAPTAAWAETGSGGRGSAFRQSGGLLDRGTHEREQMLSFFGTLPWSYGFGFGLGARYGIPVVKDGFIPTLNDSFSIEFGGDLWYANYGVLSSSYGYTGLAIPVEGQWSFHLTPKFTAYAKLGLGWAFHFWGDDITNGSSFSDGGFYWNGAWGVLYQVGDAFYLRGEVGYAGVKGGVALTF